MLYNLNELVANVNHLEYCDGAYDFGIFRCGCVWLSQREHILDQARTIQKLLHAKFLLNVTDLSGCAHCRMGILFLCFC